MTMIEEAKNCTSCLDWHKYCNAECCRLYTIKIPGLKGLRKGQTIKFFLPRINDDIKWYFELHGAIVTGNMIQIRLKDYEYKNDKLYIHRKCDYLKDNLCTGHPDKKPLICQRTNKETIHNGEYEVTPNCMFKYQNMEE